MSPDAVVALVAGVGLAAVVALQTWVLKEVYAIRVAVTRAEEQHDALKDLRLSDHAEILALALRVTALEAANR